MSSTHHHRKRKRAPSLATASDKVINPLSHTPDTLKQFTRAGYPVDHPLPSEAYPGFPHRGPNHNQHRQAYRWRNRAGPVEKEDGDGESEEEKPDYRFSAASDGDNEMFTDYTSGDGGAGQITTDAETETEPELAEHGIPQGEGARQQQEWQRRKGEIDHKARAYQSRVGCLAAVVRRCLAEGDIPTAKRAFGLLARARVKGRKVDLRYQRFWEMGAEVLMREGEASGVGGVSKGTRAGIGAGSRDGDGEEAVDDEDEDARLARETENLSRLKGYYEYLIQQYPFSKQHPNSTNSVLDFQVALFSAEMESAYTTHRRGLEGLERGGEDGDAMDVDDDEPMDYQPPDDHDHREREEGMLLPDDEEHLRGLSRREIRRREKEDGLRLAALQRMLDIAQRVDTVMETLPFSRDHELLRLRAMIALYIGDLSVPPTPRSKVEDTEGKRLRSEQRRKARGFLRKIKEGGGVLKEHDEWLLESLPSDEEGDNYEEDGGAGLPMFSSMGGYTGVK
ncbi:RNA polymerase I-specific transcription initiation factor rrn11 [Madurella mycetomatis]|uniref:RNA polymerase I-specific transcription initiation factor rrn11 n=1 Tax=Madurella mycetomatis TaxID=100816 RepID=A0A175WF83_9PEZI|nr:RNA polymerase I-specific transcription initiation factor rrn11 [Madurella mycetomatis]